MKPIRVGLIRCDTHGAYYAGLMGRFDLDLLKAPMRCGGSGKMSWQNGIIHFLFFKNSYQPDKMSVPTMPGFSIAKVWDPCPADAECFAAVFKVPEVCAKFGEVSDDVDLVFIAECNGDGSDHLKLASPGLRKGVPTFIDKPFAFDIKDAVRIVRLARANRTPVYSSSILREMPEGVRFRRRLEEIAPVNFGTVMGCGGSFANDIHSLSVAQNVFGSGVKSVECMGDYELAHVLLHYGEQGEKRRQPDVMVNCLRESGAWTWLSGLHAVAYSNKGCIVSEFMSDYNFPEGALRILANVRKMVLTRKPAAPYDEMLELIAIATAARRAYKERRPVKLGEVWKEKDFL